MSQELQKLNNRHYKMIDLCLRGFTNKQISEQLQMSDSSVSVIISAPLFQHELSLRRGQLTGIKDEHMASAEDDVSKTLKEGALRAAQRLILNTNCGNPAAENSASEAILDRTGFSRVTKQESKIAGVHLVITPELAGLIKSTIDMESL